MSFFQDVFSNDSPNRRLVGQLFSDLVDAGIVPRTVTRYGFTVNIADEFNRVMSQATEEQCQKAVDLIRERLLRQ